MRGGLLVIDYTKVMPFTAM